MRQSRRWKQFFLGVGLPENLVAEYCAYVDGLSAKNLPVIFEFRHLAALLGKTPAYLASAVHGTEKHYRTFSIPKRRGGVRQIDAPLPTLLECQQWILHEILEKRAVHRSAHGFVPGRSIKSNATVHLHSKMLLKMDLKDFFPSISIRRVIAVFQNMGYPLNVAYSLSRLCCLKDRLPQGSAASPSLSNQIANRLDRRLSAFAASVDLGYTRYADDLTFSGDIVSNRIVEIASKIIRNEGFSVQESKTQIIDSRGQMIVTGLSISGGRLRIPRAMRRSLKQELLYIARHGITSHKSKRRIRDPFYSFRLIGKLGFWAWVEPENSAPIDGLKMLRSQLGFAGN